MNAPPKQLLWVDDDNPLRFYSEIEYLEEACNYRVTMVNNIEAAAHYLLDNRYDAVILDQMLPFSERDRTTKQVSKWGGCFLSSWLRGSDSLDQTDWAENDIQVYEALQKIQPNQKNQNTPILLVSAIKEPGPLKALSNINGVKQPLDKPISGEEIEHSLAEYFGGE